jgi:hypothetical protein
MLSRGNVAGAAPIWTAAALCALTPLLLTDSCSPKSGVNAQRAAAVQIGSVLVGSLIGNSYLTARNLFASISRASHLYETSEGAL